MVPGRSSSTAIPPRLGLAGCGDVASRYLEGCQRLRDAGASVSAVCDPDRDRAETMATRFGVDRTFATVDDLLDSDTVDVLLNLTPTPLHAAVTRAGLERGLHVYSEKPIATTAEEGRELARQAAASPGVLLCAPAMTVFPLWRMVRYLIDGGTIGRPRAMRARFELGPLPWRRHATGATWFTAPDVGPLRDVGIYALHAMLDLFGRPTDVVCQSALERDGAAAEAMSLAMTFEDGALGSLETGFFVHASLIPWAEIYGERGTIALDMREPRAPLRVCRVAEHGEQPAWREISGDGIVRKLGCDTRGADDWFDYLAGIEEMLDVIRTGRDSPLSPERACDVLEVIDHAHAGGSAGSVA